MKKATVRNIEPLLVDMQETSEVIERKRVTGPDSERLISLACRNLISQGYALGKIIIDKDKFYIEGERPQKKQPFKVDLVWVFQEWQR